MARSYIRGCQLKEVILELLYEEKLWGPISESEKKQCCYESIYFITGSLQASFFFISICKVIILVNNVQKTELDSKSDSVHKMASSSIP